MSNLASDLDQLYAKKLLNNHVHVHVHETSSSIKQHQHFIAKNISKDQEEEYSEPKSSNNKHELVESSNEASKAFYDLCSSFIESIHRSNHEQLEKTTTTSSLMVESSTQTGMLQSKSKKQKLHSSKFGRRSKISRKKKRNVNLSNNFSKMRKSHTQHLPQNFSVKKPFQKLRHSSTNNKCSILIDAALLSTASSSSIESLNS